MNIISKKGDVEYIDLLAVIEVLKMNVIYILLLAILFGSAVYAGTYFFVSPTYEAKCSMYINNKSNVSDMQSTAISASDLNASAQLVKTYSVIIKNQTLLREVMEQAQVDMTMEELRKAVYVGSIDGTEVLGITVTGTNPKEAARIANAITEITPAFIAEIIEGSSVHIIERATIPDEPVGPRYKLFAAIGFLFGAMLSVAVIILKEMMDDTVKSESTFEQWPYPVLGQIPDFESKSKNMNAYYR